MAIGWIFFCQHIPQEPSCCRLWWRLHLAAQERIHRIWNEVNTTDYLTLVQELSPYICYRYDGKLQAHPQGIQPQGPPRENHLAANRVLRLCSGSRWTCERNTTSLHHIYTNSRDGGIPGWLPGVKKQGHQYLAIIPREIHKGPGMHQVTSTDGLPSSIRGSQFHCNSKGFCQPGTCHSRIQGSGNKPDGRKHKPVITSGKIFQSPVSQWRQHIVPHQDHSQPPGQGE